MSNQNMSIAFGEISHFLGSTNYTATSNWQLLSETWDIKMYQTLPDSNKPVEMSSVTILAENLWQPTQDLLSEMEQWDILSDEALINLENNLE